MTPQEKAEEMVEAELGFAIRNFHDGGKAEVRRKGWSAFLPCFVGEDDWKSYSLAVRLAHYKLSVEAGRKEVDDELAYQSDIEKFKYGRRIIAMIFRSAESEEGR